MSQQMNELTASHCAGPLTKLEPNVWVRTGPQILPSMRDSLQFSGAELMHHHAPHALGSDFETVREWLTTYPAKKNIVNYV